MSARLDQLQPWLAPYAAYLVRRFGLRVTSTYRSPYEQAQLYAVCSHGRCPYPVAPPGRSMHQGRRAFDCAADPATLRRAGAIWELMGGTWGGRGSDPIHFEA